MSTVIEVVEEVEVAEEAAEDQSETKSEAPESLFSHTEPVSMVLPEAPTDVPQMLIPEKNPKLYQLVQMSGESSFWWDSTDSADAATGGLGQNFSSFESSISGAIVDGNRIRFNPSKLCSIGFNVRRELHSINIAWLVNFIGVKLFTSLCRAFLD